MKLIAKTLALLSIVTILALAGSCGKKSEKEESTAQKTTTAGQPEDVQSFPKDAVPFAPEIVDGGFEAVFYDYFPSPVAGKQGKMILYRSAKGGKDGGMIFVQEMGAKFEWVWHWYFEDASPKSVKNAEINNDGLWDIRVTMANGRTLELLQDDSFTLGDVERADKIALNGTSSPPSEGHPLWYCFDGFPSTAWMSNIEGSVKPFIEVASPLGLADGILSIRALAENQPRKCDILAAGKKIQSIDLEKTTDVQLIQLKSDFKTAKKIRLVIMSCHGDCREVAIAELAIK